MNAITRILQITALLLSFIGNANANFHLWRTDQIYSSPDGKIQYIVLLALSSGQEFISGHTLAVSQGATTHTFTFTRDLSGDTATTTGGDPYYGGGITMGKTMLMATQGFADLHQVTPDFIIPDGFLFTTGGGSINWGGGYDIFSYTTIPTDGNMALFRAGVTATNAPSNFAGQMGSIVASSSPANVQGLWWNPAESGWGVNLTLQGSVLFGTWFTYATDGTGLWVVMPNAAPSTTNPNSYTGEIFTVSGPRFDAFNTAQIATHDVGSATFSFSDANNGTFSYTLNGVAQSKAITRQIFDSPVPTCVEGGTPGVNYQALWWNSAESGWGINITHQGDVIFATWFTYDTSGKGLWVVMAHGSKTGTGVYAGDLFQTSGPRFDSFDTTKVATTKVGTGTFTFTDPGNGSFAYTLNGVTQTKAITREIFSTPASACN